jgi:flagellar export protein FliJ
MPRFHFRLQQILDVKQQRERALAVQLAAHAAALQHARELLRVLVEQRDGVLSMLAMQGTGLTSEDVVQGFAYVDAADARIAAQTAAVEQAERELDALRAALVRCRQEVEMLKALRARAFAAWQRDELRHEEKAADEIATTRYLHLAAANHSNGEPRSEQTGRGVSPRV